MDSLKKLWEFVSSKNFMAFLALAGSIFAIYQTFFYEKSKSLTISQSTFNRVFDVYQPVGGLEISYAGENLRTTKKVLWAVTLTIVNSGETGIKIGDFDLKAPLGIEIKDGTIVDNPKYLASNDYLQKTLELIISKEKIILSPIILEPKDYININFLILGSENIKPKINSFGVIAGIGRIKNVTTIAPINNKSVWKSAIEADSNIVHLIRYFAYFFGGTFLLLALAFIVTFPLSIIEEKYNTKKREKLISKFKENQDISREDRFLIEIYKKNGITPIKKVWELLDNIKKYNKASEQLKENVDSDLKEFILNRMAPATRNRMKTELEDRGMVTFEGNIGSYDSNLEKSLKELMKFLGIEDFNEESAELWNLFNEHIRMES